MLRRDRTWILTGTLVALSGAGFVLLRHHRERRVRRGDESVADRFQGFSTRPFSTPSVDPPQPETPEQIDRAVNGQMMRWRAAILNKDAPAVIACDIDFKAFPERYRKPLELSAQTDENERVRAFSTRVLGKMKDPDEGPVFKRLLRDSSPYVRQNAAWGLGELREGGSIAIGELRHAQAHDSAEAVRLAAKDALGKIE